MTKSEKILMQKANLQKLAGRGRDVKTLQILWLRNYRKTNKNVDVKLLLRVETLNYIVGK